MHHVELWVPDLPRALRSFGWLLGELGYAQYQDWQDGRSWRKAATYIVVEASPARSAATHDRKRPGLNHLAFHVKDRADLDRLVAQAPAHGWSLLFADQHPHAGGAQHEAGYLEDEDGFEVELVVIQPTAP
ncbi:VOC family protein [Actinospica durhamensis]|uniref:VOC family protein n=1 Tax=Actinospica durhamensis TaxID=1508375 RepID=A0A941EWX3_9ACTN|nr:VOC family protein [Actinospica durhamensis]